MSGQKIREAVHHCVKQYLEDLQGEDSVALYRLVIWEAEAAVIGHVLQHTDYNQARSARILGITRNTLKKKMLEHGLALDK